MAVGRTSDAVPDDECGATADAAAGSFAAELRLAAPRGAAARFSGESASWATPALLVVVPAGAVFVLDVLPVPGAVDLVPEPEGWAFAGPDEDALESC